MKSLFRFSRRRWSVFGLILALVYCLTYLGIGGILIPFVGGPLFLASLMLWFVPGVLFAWTGFFEFHEFGASPTGWAGHAVMVIFYASAALLLSWPFGPGKPAKPE